jgi:hypothetical protein
VLGQTRPPVSVVRGLIGGNVVPIDPDRVPA